MQSLEVIIEFLSYKGAQSNDPADSTRIKNRVQDSNISGLIRHQNEIADGVVDLPLAVPASDSEYLLIFVDRTISMKLNGSSDVIELKPRAAGTKALVYYQRGTINSLTISNSSGDIANIDIILANK